MKLPITALAMLAVVPMLAAQAPLDEAAVALRRHAALVALDRYLETWNSRDAAVWATSLHFPHVRPGPGAFEMTRSPEEYVKGVNFAETLKTGWHHSEWVTREVLQVGAEKIHASGTWQRYTEDGRPLAGSDITYIITRIDGRWGVQARFAAGVNGIDSAAANAELGLGTRRGNRVHAVVELTRSPEARGGDSLPARQNRRWPGRNMADGRRLPRRPGTRPPAHVVPNADRFIEGRAGDGDRRESSGLIQQTRSQRRRSRYRRRRFSGRPARRCLEDSGSIDDGVLGAAFVPIFKPVITPVLAS